MIYLTSLRSRYCKKLYSCSQHGMHREMYDSQHFHELSCWEISCSSLPIYNTYIYGWKSSIRSYAPICVCDLRGSILSRMRVQLQKSWCDQWRWGWRFEMISAAVLIMIITARRHTSHKTRRVGRFCSAFSQTWGLRAWYVLRTNLGLLVLANFLTFSAKNPATMSISAKFNCTTRVLKFC